MKKISFPLMMAGALVGMAVAMIVKPDQQQAEKTRSVAAAEESKRIPRLPVEAVMEDFHASSSAAERLEISSQFRGFTAADFREALENAGPGESITCKSA